MRFFLLMIVLVVVSCKPDTANQPASDTKEVATLGTEEGPKKAKVKTNYNSEGIPDACDLLSAATISKYVKQPAGSIFLADGSSPQNPKARACFFKWEGSEMPNAGVMVQLQKNPVQDDVPEYFTYLISSKKTDGEKDPATLEVFIYKDWEGFGDDGAYSTESGKYVWRVGNEWAFMVAFNTTLKPGAQKKAAEAFAKEVMSNVGL